jgi:hypothetical protein
MGVIPSPARPSQSNPAVRIRSRSSWIHVTLGPVNGLGWGNLAWGPGAACCQSCDSLGNTRIENLPRWLGDRFFVWIIFAFRLGIAGSRTGLSISLSLLAVDHGCRLRRSEWPGGAGVAMRTSPLWTHMPHPRKRRGRDEKEASLLTSGVGK